jgi:hypothetical protein
MKSLNNELNPKFPVFVPHDFDWSVTSKKRKYTFMNKIAEKELVCELVLETSMCGEPTKLGKHESTMVLYGFDDDPDYYFIEWDIPTLNEVENIGIWCEEGTKELRDYDGVMCLSQEAIELLKENGFDTSYAE